MDRTKEELTQEFLTAIAAFQTVVKETSEGLQIGSVLIPKPSSNKVRGGVRLR
jgi:hypothetical protein